MVAKQEFETRQVGRTNLRMTTLGCGSATAASIFQEVPDQQARDTISHALDVGITYIDTAPQYGYGRAEHLVGDALRFRPEQYVLSTKVGRRLRPIRHEGEREYPHAWVKPFPFEQVYDYSYDGIMRSVEDSFQRLGLAKIDILLVHDIGVMTHGEEVNARLWQQLVDSGYRALTELKNSGVCSAIGLGTNEWEVQLKALEMGDWDIFLLAGRYTLLEQTSLGFLETCLKRGASVIAGAPFNGGALMGTGKWNYGAAPAEIVARVKALEDFCKEWTVPIGAAALQFPLAHKAVCNVLTGPKSPAELDGTLAWWNTTIPAEFWTALAERKLVAPGTPLPNGKTA
ncbi:MAG TPA: aldo/keto reductase [Devosia sp.]